MTPVAAAGFDPRSTAIMPAERLLPAWHAARRAAAPAARARGSGLRRACALAATALCLTAVAMFLAPLRAPAIKAVRLPLLGAPERPGTSHDKQVTDAQQVPQLPTARALPRGMERAALDALIAGDLARAQQLYAQLARARRADATFATLERILSHRAAAPR